MFSQLIFPAPSGEKNYGHVIIYTGIRVASSPSATGRGSALRARNILKFSSGERDNGPAEGSPHGGAGEWVSHVKTNSDQKTTGDRGVVVAVAKHCARHANTVNNRLVEQSDNARRHDYRYLCDRKGGEMVGGTCRIRRRSPAFPG